jgi:thiol-disulfide isomerase/thioredoxin
MSATQTRLRIAVYRLIVFGLGAILLAAGVFKGADLDQFALQIRQYGILPDGSQLAFGVAWFMVVVEAAIGAALVVNWRPRLMLAAFGTLMLFFIAALGWAIVQGGVSDCGCFGPAARRSPTDALVEDLLLLAAAGAAWRLRDETVYFKHPIKGFSVATACVLAMVLPLILGPMSTGQTASTSQGPDQGAGMVLQSTTGEQFDLNSGAFLLTLMSTDCGHCRESVPRLNEIVADAENLITVYGLAVGNQAEIDRFVEDNFAFYQVLPINEKRLSSLMGDGPLPQYLLVRDGQILNRWQGEVPELRALMDLTEKEKDASPFHDKPIRKG